MQTSQHEKEMAIVFTTENYVIDWIVVINQGHVFFLQLTQIYYLY